jgi:hypothetical protein
MGGIVNSSEVVRAWGGGRIGAERCVTGFAELNTADKRVVTFDLAKF